MVLFEPECLSSGTRCRCFFVLCLGVSAIALGWTAHYHQARSEKELAENQFQAIAERAAFSVRENTLRSRAANEAVASLYSNLFPNADDWPFVSIPRYNAMVEPISRIAVGDTAGIGLGVVTFMEPEQVGDFNAFQAAYLEANFGPSISKTVYKLPAEERQRPLRPSTLNLSAPVSQSFGPNAERTIMLDLFSTPLFRPLIEKHKQAAAESTGGENAVPFGFFSDFVRNVSGKNTDADGPSFYYTHPIYPENDKSTVVGMTVSPIVWNEVLKNAFRVDVSGIDCVIESSNKEQFSYSIRDGQPSYCGLGDQHRGGVDGDLTLEVSLPDQQPKDGTPMINYRVTFYPSREFYRVYASLNPVVAMLGAIAIMIFTSFLFFLYDYSLRKDMLRKQAVLEAKRNFMRFVSHEVRTPLNTVSMGLTVVREDIARLFEASEYSNKGPSAPSLCDEMPIAVERHQASELIKLTEDIHKNADRAVDILNDLLNYDKIESGKLSLERTVIPVWSLIENVVDEFKLTAKFKEIDLVLDLSTLHSSGSGDILPSSVLQHKVFGDSIRLSQVIRNLLSNALKFTPEGGNITVKIELLGPSMESAIKASDIRVESVGEYIPQSGTLKLSVTDTGAGMSEEQLKKLFGQGVQFNANILQEGRGSGLGLYIAKGIIEHHGGKLEALSAGLDQGSSFTATLPLYIISDRSAALMDPSKQVQSTPIPSSTTTGSDTNRNGSDSNENGSSESSEDSSDAQSSESHRALVVDDAPMNRKLLSRLLSNRGWDCDCAENGLLAVQMAQHAEQDGRPYNCILLDYEMPVMNGPMAASELRAIGCKACVLGVTGNVLPKDVEYFKRCGVVEVFAKPVNIDDVESLLRSRGLLEGRQTDDVQC